MKLLNFFLSPSKGVRVFILISFNVIGAGAGGGGWAGGPVDGPAEAGVAGEAVGRAGTLDPEDCDIVAMRVEIGGGMGAGVGLVGSCSMSVSIGERPSSLWYSSSSLASEKNSACSCLSW